MMRRALSIAALLLAALPAAAGWYNASWPYRVEFNVDPTYVNEDGGVIILNAANLHSDFWTNNQGVGDIRITEADGTTEVAIHNIGFVDSGTTGTDQIRIAYGPSASVVTSGFIYYGNSGASLPSSSDTYGSENAYDANIVAAYYPGISTTDYTGNGYTLTAVGTPGTTTSNWAGLTAATYNGSTQYHYNTTSLSVLPTSMFALVSCDTTTATNTFVALRNSGTSYQVLVLRATSGNAVVSLARGDTGGLSTATESGTFSDATWMSVAFSRDATSGTTYAYRDGGNTGSDASTIAAPTLDRICLGSSYHTSAVDLLDGNIAYAEVSGATRSANYNSTLHNFWFNQSAMVEFGPEEDMPGAYDTGWVEFTSATTAVATVGDLDWTNASSALTDIISAATMDLPDAEESYELRLTDSSTALSSLSGTIAGIEVEIAATGEDGATNQLFDQNVQLIIGGSPTGTNKASATRWTDNSGMQHRVYGGPTDTWGLTPTDTQLKASNAGVAFSVFSDGGNNAFMSVYRIRWRIYTAAPGGGTPDTGFFNLLD